MLPTFYTLKEIRELLKISDSTARRAIKSGQLQAYKIAGNEIRIREEDALKFIEESKIQWSKLATFSDMQIAYKGKSPMQISEKCN